MARGDGTKRKAWYASTSCRTCVPALRPRRPAVHAPLDYARPDRDLPRRAQLSVGRAAGVPTRPVPQSRSAMPARRAPQRGSNMRMPVQSRQGHEKQTGQTDGHQNQKAHGLQILLGNEFFRTALFVDLFYHNTCLRGNYVAAAISAHRNPPNSNGTTPIAMPPMPITLESTSKVVRLYTAINTMKSAETDGHST